MTLDSDRTRVKRQSVLMAYIIIWFRFQLGSLSGHRRFLGLSLFSVEEKIRQWEPVKNISPSCVCGNLYFSKECSSLWILCTALCKYTLPLMYPTGNLLSQSSRTNIHKITCFTIPLLSCSWRLALSVTRKVLWSGEISDLRAHFRNLLYFRGGRLKQPKHWSLPWSPRGQQSRIG